MAKNKAPASVTQTKNLTQTQQTHLEFLMCDVSITPASCSKLGDIVKNTRDPAELFAATETMLDIAAVTLCKEKRTDHELVQLTSIMRRVGKLGAKGPHFIETASMTENENQRLLALQNYGLDIATTYFKTVGPESIDPFHYRLFEIIANRQDPSLAEDKKNRLKSLVSLGNN